MQLKLAHVINICYYYYYYYYYYYLKTILWIFHNYDLNTINQSLLFDISGFTNTFEQFAIFFLGLFFVSLSASAISFCISALVRIFAVANLLIAMCYVVMMVS